MNTPNQVPAPCPPKTTWVLFTDTSRGLRFMSSTQTLFATFSKISQQGKNPTNILLRAANYFFFWTIYQERQMVYQTFVAMLEANGYYQSWFMPELYANLAIKIKLQYDPKDVEFGATSDVMTHLENRKTAFAKRAGRQEIRIDNREAIPYNLYLNWSYKAHISTLRSAPTWPPSNTSTSTLVKAETVRQFAGTCSSTSQFPTLKRSYNASSILSSTPRRSCSVTSSIANASAMSFYFQRIGRLIRQLVQSTGFVNASILETDPPGSAIDVPFATQRIWSPLTSWAELRWGLPLPMYTMVWRPVSHVGTAINGDFLEMTNFARLSKRKMASGTWSRFRLTW